MSSDTKSTDVARANKKTGLNLTDKQAGEYVALIALAVRAKFAIDVLAQLAAFIESEIPGADELAAVKKAHDDLLALFPEYK